ncbi:MAG: sulfite exporter TauE/SafE family protein [Paracoccus sp. BP8]|nr:MAG: sulfite exporter TauE/SafE family protein [Paracoccus sp. BP8]
MPDPTATAALHHEVVILGAGAAGIAIALSLVAVTAFGLTTALNYARAGHVDWPLALVFVVGGLSGGMLGARLARHLSTRRDSLHTGFAALVVLVAIYMLVRRAAGPAG